MGYLLQAALIYSLFFVFATMAPYVMERVLHLPADQFGRYYLFLAVGFFIGNLLVSRSGGHHDVARQVSAGLSWQLIGAGVALLLVLTAGAGAPQPDRARHATGTAIPRRRLQHVRLRATRARGNRRADHGLRAGDRLAARAVVLRLRRGALRRRRQAARGVG
jgi:hypothetical protein